MFFSSNDFNIFEASYTNSVDPDQTAPVGAVWSGSTIFASMLMLNRHFQMQFNFAGVLRTTVFWVYTEVPVQHDTVTFE